MKTASSIVGVLLEDDFDFKRDAIQTQHQMTADQRRGLNPQVDHDPNLQPVSFGFAINTSPQQMVEDAAAELGLELDDKSWEAISKDAGRIENNVVALLKQHGLTVSPEGHGNDGALIGTAWVLPGTKAWEWISKWEDDTEPLTTTSGTLTNVEGSEKLFDGVSELGSRVLDIDVGFFDLGEIHAYRDGLPMP